MVISEKADTKSNVSVNIIVIDVLVQRLIEQFGPMNTIYNFIWKKTHTHTHFKLNLEVESKLNFEDIEQSYGILQCECVFLFVPHASIVQYYVDRLNWDLFIQRKYCFVLFFCINARPHRQAHREMGRNSNT